MFYPKKKIDISKININLERKDLINKLTLKEEIKSEEVLFKIFELIQILLILNFYIIPLKFSI